MKAKLPPLQRQRMRYIATLNVLISEFSDVGETVELLVKARHAMRAHYDRLGVPVVGDELGSDEDLDEAA